MLNLHVGAMGVPCVDNPIAFPDIPAATYCLVSKGIDNKCTCSEACKAISGDPTIVFFLRHYANSKALFQGKKIHARLMDCRDVFVGNLLVNMYSKCGALEDANKLFVRMHGKNVFSWNIMMSAYAQHRKLDEAIKVFQLMPQKNLVSWNSMITAYAQNSHAKQALQLFQKMQLQGLSPDKLTFISLLNACVAQEELAQGIRMHKLIVKARFDSDVVVSTALVNLYGKLGHIEDARIIFDQMSLKNVVSWNAMIAIYVQWEHNNDAIHLFNRMESKNITPDDVTFVSILSALAIEQAIAKGKRIHARIMGMKWILVNNSLMNMYRKCGYLEDCMKIFDRMPWRDVVSWNTMMAACIPLGNEILSLFRQMHVEVLNADEYTYVIIIDACAEQILLAKGKILHAQIISSCLGSNVFICNAILNMYGKCGTLVEASRIFATMHAQDVITWTALITACAQYGHSKKALELFSQMHFHGLLPDGVTFISALDACSSVASITFSKLLHSHLLYNGLTSDATIGNALVTTYGKCGVLEETWRIFDILPKQNAVSWTSLITNYALHGHCKEVLKLFREMQLNGLRPLRITFLTVLYACSHAGLVDDGCQFLAVMFEFDAAPVEEHFNCIIDMLGRVGWLGEATDLMFNLPFDTNEILCMTLRSVYQIHTDLK